MTNNIAEERENASDHWAVQDNRYAGPGQNPLQRELSTIVDKGINEANSSIAIAPALSSPWHQRFSGARMYEGHDYRRPGTARKPVEAGAPEEDAAAPALGKGPGSGPVLGSSGLGPSYVIDSRTAVRSMMSRSGIGNAPLRAGAQPLALNAGPLGLPAPARPMPAVPAMLALPPAPQDRRTPGSTTFAPTPAQRARGARNGSMSASERKNPGTKTAKRAFGTKGALHSSNTTPPGSARGFWEK